MEIKIQIGTVFESKLDRFKQTTLCPICKAKVTHTKEAYYKKDLNDMYYTKIEDTLQKHISTDKACIRQQKLTELGL